LVAVIWCHWWRCFSSLFIGVAVVFTTAPLKLSPQTQFILEQMTDRQAGVVKVDALSARVDQLQVQVHLSTDAVHHVVRDQQWMLRVKQWLSLPWNAWLGIWTILLPVILVSPLFTVFLLI
jgi:hypothetical protein